MLLPSYAYVCRCELRERYTNVANNRLGEFFVRVIRMKFVSFASLLEPPYNPSPLIARAAHLNHHPVTGDDPDAVELELTAQVSKDIPVPPRENHPKEQPRECFLNHAFLFYQLCLVSHRYGPNAQKIRPFIIRSSISACQIARPTLFAGTT